MTFFSCTHPTARKAHKCVMCWRTIQPGEQYRRGFGADGERAWTYKECAHCAAFIKYASRLTGDEEYFDDLLMEFEPRTIAEARVHVQYRRKWRRRNGSLYPVPEPIYHEDKYGFGYPIGIKPGATP